MINQSHIKKPSKPVVSFGSVLVKEKKKNCNATIKCSQANPHKQKMSGIMFVVPNSTGSFTDTLHFDQVGV